MDPDSPKAARSDSAEKNGARDWATLVDALGHHGATRPEDIGYVFLKDGETETARLSFGALDRQARTAAQGLLARGMQGERVLLAYPPGPEFIIAFFAVLYAGATAVPAPAANAGRATYARIAGVAADADLAMALTLPDLVAHAQRILSDSAARPRGQEIPVATLQELAEATAGAAETPELPRLAPAFMAVLQYTSGSTGTPKGVMISHANIMANQRMIRDRFEHDPDTVIVGWIPMFHDMGLIGNMMQPAFVGCRGVLMSPGAFLQEPARWLRAISKYRGTTAGAPNFAFDLCVDRIGETARAGLDLSSWDVAFNGSEPVRPRTLARFAKAFAAQGLRPESCYPCYGMAEATLMISGPRKQTRPVLRDLVTPEAGAPLQAVCVGDTDAAHDIRIVDPETGHEAAAGEVGEIWFSGPSVSAGYWRNKDESLAYFGLRLADQRPEDGRRYLRTGDLGLRDADGLFVTGRIKDVLILNGRNHYPQDVEAAAQSSDPALRSDCAAAFTIDDGTQTRLALAIEVSRSAQRDLDIAGIARAIRMAVSRRLGLTVSSVLLLRQSSIPKTSSGKIQRRRCRELYLSGGLNVVGEDLRAPPPAPGEG